MIRSLQFSPLFGKVSSVSEGQNEGTMAAEWPPINYERDRRPSLGNNWNLNLQVVPSVIFDESGDNLTFDNLFQDDKQAAARNSAALIELRDDVYVPRSPFLPRTSISELDNLRIISPLYSVSSPSHLLTPKSLSLFEICSSSRRKPSDDLSMYLPDNFTPVSLEGLEKAVNRTVFQFPVITNQNKTTEAEGSEVFTDENENIDIETASSEDVQSSPEQDHELYTTSDRASINQTKFQHDDSPKEIKGVKRKLNGKEGSLNKKKRLQLHKQTPPQAEMKPDSSLGKEISPFLRNKLERERRNDLNIKFQKLRCCLPSLMEREKASKITILVEATKYADTLRQEETALESQLREQKALNEQLLKQLVDINAEL